MCKKSFVLKLLTLFIFACALSLNAAGGKRKVDQELGCCGQKRSKQAAVEYIQNEDILYLLDRDEKERVKQLVECGNVSAEQVTLALLHAKDMSQVRFLVEQCGADINGYIRGQNGMQIPLLAAVALRDELRMVRYLVRKGCVIKKKTTGSGLALSILDAPISEGIKGFLRDCVIGRLTDEDICGICREPFNEQDPVHSPRVITCCMNVVCAPDSQDLQAIGAQCPYCRNPWFCLA